MAPPLHKAIQSPAGFSTSVDAYIDSCLVKDDSGKDSGVVSVVGLSLHLGTHKDMIATWANRYEKPTEHDPELSISRAIKKLKSASEEQLTRLCVLGRNSMALALGKVNHGWIEKKDVIKYEVAHKGSVSISVDFGVPPSEHGS